MTSLDPTVPINLVRVSLGVASASSLVIAVGLWMRYHEYGTVSAGPPHPRSKRATAQLLGLLYVLCVAMTSACVAFDVEDARRVGCVALAVVALAAAIVMCTPVRWWRHG